MDYSVLTFLIGDYEVVHEIQEKSDRAEYILVTDNRSITSSTWDVVYVDNPHPEDNFDLCFHIRYNPFDYVHTDTVVKIDGSMGVNRSLDTIVDFFVDCNFDMAVCIHPTRANLYDEYVAWVQQRNYPVKQAEKVLNFIQFGEGYDVKKDSGLYQYNFMIQRKNRKNLDLNRLTHALCKYLAPEDKQIDRLDQTIGSFVINKYFPDMNILPIGQDLFDGGFFTWYAHGSNIPLTCGGGQRPPILLGKEVTTVTF